MFWRSWESPFFVFLVAVVIVGFVRAVCFDASDSSKTIKVVWALCHIIPFFMPLPYTASLYHVYANHFMQGCDEARMMMVFRMIILVGTGYHPVTQDDWPG